MGTESICRVAISYGQEFNEKQGAGFEFGIMLFTPPFACFGGCGKAKKKKSKRHKLFKMSFI